MKASLKQFGNRLRALIAGGNLDRDFDAELESHVEMLTDENIRRGMSPVEAHRQARIRVGAASSLRIQHRETRGFAFLEDLFQDLSFGARLMLKDRWFSAAAIAAIALGIGANTVGFTIINAAFFRGFSFERAAELHSISWQPTRGRRLPSSVPDFADWQSQAKSFSSLAGYAFAAINISDDRTAPEQTQGAWVTANHFDVLRQPPLLGRTFIAGEDRPTAESVVLIGYDLWQRRFSLDPNVIGTTLRVNGRPATIIGVMPDGMKFPDNSEIWAPFVATADQLARDVRVLAVFGRLAPGVTKQQASAEVDAIAKRILDANPSWPRALSARRLRPSSSDTSTATLPGCLS